MSRFYENNNKQLTWEFQRLYKFQAFFHVVTCYCNEKKKYTDPNHYITHDLFITTSISCLYLINQDSLS